MHQSNAGTDEGGLEKLKKKKKEVSLNDLTSLEGALYMSIWPFQQLYTLARICE